MRVAALAVVPRVVRVLSRIHQAEAQVAAPVSNDQRIEEPPPVVASPARVQKTPTRRWLISSSVKRRSPPLCAWWAPTGSRAPPSHFGGSRSSAYTHRRSFPINAVDPMGTDHGPWGGLGPTPAIQPYLSRIQSAQQIVQRYSPGSAIPSSAFGIDATSLLIAAPAGGYAMETNTLTGDVNVNPAIFNVQRESGLVLLVGALANETYHHRNRNIHGARAERESAQLEEAVLLAWQKDVESSCYITEDERKAKQRLLAAIWNGLDQARSIVVRYGGSPTY